MGFFSDLKEDLSQAVSEMKPDEGRKSRDKDKEVEGDRVIKNIEAAEDINLGKLLKEIEEDNLEVELESDKVSDDEGDFQPKEMFISRLNEEAALITPGMEIIGDIAVAGSLDVFGAIHGNIQVNGKMNVAGTIDGDSLAAEVNIDNARIVGNVTSLGALVIGRNSVVFGNISAVSAVIGGAIKGDIDVKGPVVLEATAIVMGNIKSKSVQINNGAVVDGSCSQCYADVNPSKFFEKIDKDLITKK